MAIGIPRFGARTGAGGSFSTTVTVAYPNDVVAGDFLIVAIASNNTADFTAAGWTGVFAQAGSSSRFTFLYKTADAADVGAVNLTVTISATLVSKTLKMMAVSGVDPVVPLDATPTTRGTTNMAGVYTMDSQTASIPGCMPVWGMTVNDNSSQWAPIPASGPNEWMDAAQESGTTGRSGTAYWESPLAVAESTGVRGGTPAETGANAGVYLLLRPYVVNLARDTGDGSGGMPQHKVQVGGNWVNGVNKVRSGATWQ